MSLETIVVFLSSLIWAVSAMAPSVTFGDAGEFTAAAATLSLPHAPSYPLYCILSRAFGAVLPFGNWAYRTNLFSAVSAALALSVLAGAMRKLSLPAPARWAALLLLCVNPVWITHAGVTEVFLLHVLILSGFIWCAANFSTNLWEDRPMALLGLLAGFGIANHHTVILVIPALIWEASTKRPERPRRSLAHFTFFMILSLACYLYLPLRSVTEPPLDWGHPTSWQRFFHVFFRRDYGSFSLTTQGQAGAWAGRWEQILRYGGFSVAQVGWAGASLALLGLAGWSSMAQKISWRLPVAWLVLSGPFFLFLGNPQWDPMTTGALDRFYLSSWLAGALLAAGGVALLYSWHKAAAWVVCLMPLLWTGAASRTQSSRQDFSAYDYGRNIQKSLPPNSSLYMDGGDDTFYTLAFLRYAENRRPDLDLRDRGGLVFRNPYGRDFRTLSSTQKVERRLVREQTVAATGFLHYTSLSDRLLPGWRLAPVGLTRKAMPPSERAAPLDPWPFYALRFDEGLNESRYRHRALISFYPYMRAEDYRYRGDYASALAWLRWAIALGGDTLWLKPAAGYAATMMGFESLQSKSDDAALLLYSFAVSMDPAQADPHLGLGLAQERKGLLQEAEKSYKKSAEINNRSGQAFYNLGALYWKQERWVEAREAIEKAVKLSPDNPEWKRRLQQAVVLAQRGKNR